MHPLFKYRPYSTVQECDVHVPGKLFIAGEYAVLQPRNVAVVCAIDQYLTCHIRTNHLHAVTLTTELSDLEPLSFDSLTVDTCHSSKWQHVLTAIRITHNLLHELSITPLPYHLHFATQLINADGIKYGFGSSGAVIAATIRAILRFHNVDIVAPLTWFKLSAMTSVTAQLSGSLADMAANCYGGIIAYRTLNQSWLQQQLSLSMPLLTLLEQDWQDLNIQSLVFPDDWQFLVGWTQSPASTDKMIQKLQHNEHYEQFAKESTQCVERLIQALTQHEFESFCHEMHMNRQLLRQLAKAQSFVIETPALTQLIEDAHAHGFVAKSSGAGGGDCGIAVGNNVRHIEALLTQWHAHNIVPLNICIAPHQF